MHSSDSLSDSSHCNSMVSHSELHSAHIEEIAVNSHQMQMH